MGLQGSQVIEYQMIQFQLHKDKMYPQYGTEASLDGIAVNQNGMAANQQLNNAKMPMMAMGYGRPRVVDPNKFLFQGNSFSFMARIDSISDQQLQRYVDATVVIMGTQIQSYNKVAYYCTILWASILIFPIFLICTGCWKKCTLPAWQVDISAYNLLGRLMRMPNLKNFTLNVYDNKFNQAKAQILYNHLIQSQTRGFTFANLAGNYDFQQRQYSDFGNNMRPIKILSNIMSQIRWGAETFN